MSSLTMTIRVSRSSTGDRFERDRRLARFARLRRGQHETRRFGELGLGKGLLPGQQRGR